MACVLGTGGPRLVRWAEQAFDRITPEVEDLVDRAPHEKQMRYAAERAERLAVVDDIAHQRGARAAVRRSVRALSCATSHHDQGDGEQLTNAVHPRNLAITTPLAASVSRPAVHSSSRCRLTREAAT
jgi:hypothetical protein